MKGMFIIKDKQTGEILVELHPWSLFLLLTYSEDIKLDRNKIQIFIDDTQIPMLEGMENEG